MSVAAVAAVAVTGASAAARRNRRDEADVGCRRRRKWTRDEQASGDLLPREVLGDVRSGLRVLLTPKAKTGSRFLRWGGNCTGAGACRVRVSALAAVAAQFVGPGTRPKPPPSNSAVEPAATPVTGTAALALSSWSRLAPEACWTSRARRAPQLPVQAAGRTTPPSRSRRRRSSRIARSPRRPLRKPWSTGPMRRSPIPSRGASRDLRGRCADCGRGVPGKHRVRRYAQPQVHVERPAVDGGSIPTTDEVRTAGSYSGYGYGGTGVKFLVPAGAGSVLDFTSPSSPAVTCAGGGTYYTPFTIAKATIKSDRSFTATTSQKAVVDRANATITYSVTGRFQGPPRPVRRLRPGCTEKTSCSPIRPTASARLTTNSGRRLGLARHRAEVVESGMKGRHHEKTRAPERGTVMRQRIYSAWLGSATVVLVMALAGCGGGGTPEAASSESTGRRRLRIRRSTPLTAEEHVTTLRHSQQLLARR